MNALMAVLDAKGKRLTAVVPCEWAFTPGGVQLLGTPLCMNVIADGRAANIELMTLDGERVWLTQGGEISAVGKLVKGATFCLNHAHIRLARGN